MSPQLNSLAQKSHNFRNTVHTALLIIGAGLLTSVMAWTLFGWAGVVIALAVVAIGAFSIRNVSPAMVLKLYKAQPISRAEIPEISDLVEQLAKRANLPAVPTLHYVPSKMLNAFAVGSRENSAIAVTDGLLRAVNMRQLAGILAHETAHIMNGDLRVMGLADVLNRVTSFLSQIGLLLGLGVFGLGLNIPLLGPLFLIAAPMVGGLLQLALSRTREYDADLDGASLTGDPEGLASALLLLEKTQKGVWEGMFLPGGRSPHPSLLRTHPKTEDRVARLRALRNENAEQIVVQTEHRPSPSFVPPVRNPRIQWQRLGIYY